MEVDCGNKLKAGFQVFHRLNNLTYHVQVLSLVPLNLG